MSDVMGSSDDRAAADKIAGLIKDDNTVPERPRKSQENTENSAEEANQAEEDAANRSQGDAANPEEGASAEAEEPAAEGKEPPADGEPETEPEETGEAGEDELEFPETLTGLAEALEIDAEAFDDLKLTVKVNGEEREVPISELRTQFSMGQDYRAKTAEHSEAVRAFQEEQQAVQQERTQYLDAFANMVAAFEQSMKGEEMSEAQLDELYATDPEQARAYEKERNARIARLEEAKQQVAEYRQYLGEQMATAFNQTREREMGELRSHVPEWFNDDGQMSNDALAEIVEKAGKYYGFTAEDVAQTVNHKLFLMARDAFKYRELGDEKPKAQAKLKQVKKRFKVPSAGAARSKGEENRERLGNLKRRARQSGSDRDAAAVVEQLLE